MGITFRHDAAAVALPSVTAGSRKYGQQLVLQQQQQKYNAQQAGYDRMFQAGRDAQQQNFMAGRDQRQQEFIQGRDNAQNQFAMQQAEAQRQQAFMDEARKQSGRFIMDSIEAGEYDPQTARELRQNLIDEAEALGNPKLDATQRAEALAALRARRATLSANRQPKAPTPTRDEQLKTFLGESYSQYGNLPWVPDGKGGFSVSKEALGQQQKEMELQQKMRPKSFQEYYSENEDKFQKDLDATIQSMEKVDPKTGAVTTATPEQALEKMRKDYEFRQKALGRPQYGTPTDAPALPGAAPSGTAFAPGSRLGDQASALGMNPSRSILEAQTPPADYSAQNRVNDLLGQQRIDPNAPAPVPRGAPPMPAPAAPASAWDMMSYAEKRKAMAAAQKVQEDSVVYTPEEIDERARSFVEHGDFGVGEAPEEFKALFSPQQPANPVSVNPNPLPLPLAPNAQPSNPWAEVASGGNNQPAPTAAQPSMQQPSVPAAPDFGSLAASAEDESDRAVIGRLQSVYEQAQSPEIQSAISVLVNSTNLTEVKAAKDYLKSVGVDIDQSIAKPAPKTEKVNESQRKWRHR